MLLCLLGVATTMRAEGPSANRAELAKRFQKATTESERLAVAIAFIDGGHLGRGSKVAAVDEVFGTSFAKRARRIQDGGVAWEMVAIGTFVVPEGPEIASPYYVGWVLAVSFDRNGIVRKYYLTKEWK